MPIRVRFANGSNVAAVSFQTRVMNAPTVRQATRINWGKCGLGCLGRQPGDLGIKSVGVPGLVPGPGNGGHDDSVSHAPHPGGLGFQECRDRAQIQRPPPAASFALIIFRAPPPAFTTAALHRGGGPDGSDHDPGFLVIMDVFHDRFFDSKQSPP